MDGSTHHFCPNSECKMHGKIGNGNIGIHSHIEKRFICHCCQKTFSETVATPFYRRRNKHQFIGEMLSLLAHGCPPQAIVSTYEVDERTVADWEKIAGAHCKDVHQAIVQKGQMDLFQVQTDEIRVKAQGQIFWMASAIAVSTRPDLFGIRRCRPKVQKHGDGSRSGFTGQGLCILSASFDLF